MTRLHNELTLSMPTSYSASSSLSSSPGSPSNGFHSQGQQPGKQPKDVYDTSLPWWRAAIRRKLVASVQRESRVIARMQVSSTRLCVLLRQVYCYVGTPSLAFHLFQTINADYFYIGKDPYSMVRRLFRLHFLSRDTYVLHDRPSCHVFLRIS